MNIVILKTLKACIDFMNIFIHPKSNPLHVYPNSTPSTQNFLSIPSLHNLHPISPPKLCSPVRDPCIDPRSDPTCAQAHPPPSYSRPSFYIPPPSPPSPCPIYGASYTRKRLVHQRTLSQIKSDFLVRHRITASKFRFCCFLRQQSLRNFILTLK